MKKNNVLLAITMALFCVYAQVFGLSYTRNRQNNPGFLYKIKQQQESANSLFKQKPESSLFKIRTQYTQQKMREQRVQETIQQLEKEGKFVAEVKNELTQMIGSTPESKAEEMASANYDDKQNELNKAVMEYNATIGSPKSPEKWELQEQLGKVIHEKSLQKNFALKQWLKALEKKKETPEFKARAVYPNLVPKTNPTIWAPKTRQTSPFVMPRPRAVPITEKEPSILSRFINWLTGK